MKKPNEEKHHSHGHDHDHEHDHGHDHDHHDHDHDEIPANVEPNEYWQDIHQKVLDPKINKDEFKEGEFDSFSVVKNRRDFLKIMGFSFTMLPMAACTKGVVRKAIPYLEKNDKVIPGVANWYATTHDGIPVLLKTREGRPIKVEGNEKSLYMMGGANAIAQASILSLYDSYRLKSPTKDGNPIKWEIFEQNFKTMLEKARSENKNITLITDIIKSPSTLALIADLKKEFPNLEHIAYSPSAHSLINRSFREEVHVEYDLSQCDYVLGVGSDFLGIGSDSIHLSKQYAQRKEQSLNAKPFKHVQLESLMTMTGSNADERYPLNTDELKALMLLIYSKLSSKVVNVKSSKDLDTLAVKLVKELQASRGRSVVINDVSDMQLQKVVNEINNLLANFQATIKVSKNPYIKYDAPEKFEALVDALAGKKTDVDVLIMVDVNPYYNYYDTNKLTEAFGRVPQKVAFTFSEDETSQNCQYVAPLAHQYEMWNDTVISGTELAVTQPVIVSINDSKPFQEIILRMLGKDAAFDLYMKEVWKTHFYPGLTAGTLDHFWMTAVQDGVLAYKNSGTTISPDEDLDKVIKALSEKIDLETSLYLALYEKVAIGDGRYANNPWLQELPDPVTKVTWDNYALIATNVAKQYQLTTGDMIEIKSGNRSVVLPCLVQPGLAKNTIGMAVGYGRTVAGKVAARLGKNVYPFAQMNGASVNWNIKGVTFSKTLKRYELAMTQTHHSIEGRDIYRETTLDKYINNPKSGNKSNVHLISMWGEHKKTGPQWAMAIDLNKCNGCSACVVSCNAENNVPVVGREEVLNRREMHWMRIDRYYKGEEENPSVAFQPMTCHHCDNAPCETVCPVLATVHSSDGMNQQVYNRCVGTRYCANNCPYKVRRFNWFDYPHQDQNERMVLNPDVTVRSRGVMEKCSLCIQRIQEAKLQAKKEGRPLKDGEIKLACQQSCPSDAIVFGDLMDPNSKISQMIKDPRNFTVLEELNVKPRLSYLTKVKNKD